MNKLLAILRLTRIEHSLLLVVAVVAAELIGGNGKLPTLGTLLLSLITPIFISMGSFAINDYYDIKVDKINKKNRPLVTRELRPIDALYVTAASMLIGLAASYFINFYCFVLAIIFALLAIFYSYRLKEVLFWGNAYIAFTGSVAFLFGNYVVPNAGIIPNPGIIIIAVMAFTASLGREIEGTIRDYRGDVKVRNVTTIPRVIGKVEAAKLSLLLYLVSIFFSVYLFLFLLPFRYDLFYGVFILAADLIFLYVGIGYVTKKSLRFFNSARNLSLIAMGLSVIAFLLAPLI